MSITKIPGSVELTAASSTKVSAAGQNSDVVISGGNWAVDTYTGQWELNKYAYATTSLKIDEAGTLYYQFSQDGSTVVSQYPVAGFGVTSGIHTYHAAHKGAFRYVRVVFIGTGGRTYMELKTEFTNISPEFRASIAQGVTANDDAKTVKSVSFGTDPNASYSELAASGMHTGNTTTTPLTGAAVWRGTWFEWSSGYVGAQTAVESDVDGTFYVDFSNEASPTDGDESSVDDSLVITYDASETPLLNRMTPIQSRWVRLRYINGAGAQSVFSVTNTMLITAASLVMQQLDSLPKGNNLAGLVRGVMAGADTLGDYHNVSVTPDGALRISPINTLIKWEFDDAQLSVISSTVDNWLYYKDAGLVGTLEITYDDSAHTTITRQRSI